MGINEKFLRIYSGQQEEWNFVCGVTSNLLGRLWQHKNKVNEGFTKRYGVDKLVYYELHNSANEAIRREKNIKEWKRKWKLDLIEGENPTWEDLAEKMS